MATKSDVKKQLETILKHPIADEAVQLIKFIQAVASSTVSDGSTTLRHILIARPNQCYGSRLLDLAGFVVTGTNGKSVFRLTQFMCPTGERFSAPVNILATPVSLTPCFATVAHTFVNDGEDVEVQIFTWNPDGTPAPSIAVNWRCRVELPHIIL